ncbi:guanine nucleotide-binding protein alpha-2subunit [Striga asiatica]|uniref:Guanine nucleotide-binding protein alpha-2subunit n=1 Tax=Striga asiatica TaxID=4170 RepID=A0A5A7P0P1_STRAF|nr:guanine nucleotide-binding protein alpha-2subunit [Striga asiatica]
METEQIHFQMEESEPVEELIMKEGNDNNLTNQAKSKTQGKLKTWKRRTLPKSILRGHRHLRVFLRFDFGRIPSNEELKNKEREEMKAAASFLYSRNIVFRADIDGLTLRQSRWIIPTLESFLSHNLITSVNAFSTFIDSRAEVSMKNVLSFSAKAVASSVDGPQVTQIGLVAHEHDHDVRICVIPQLF